MIGTRLGPYEILEKIGAGGMGEVYRARDSRLGRDVAVKVLPAHLASDPDRLRRFEQEARAAGILNHPNILAIYDVGTHAGAPYLVTELLEGETLRERLDGAPLPARKAVELAAQVARGLAAAHGKGIVHRDLKPENLFVTREGRIKILDFGLAKLTQVDESGGAMTNLPTTPLATDPGRVMGTAGYMAPEQVRGRPADARSDVFAFGAILYEMLTGRRAFRRDSAVETMNAILKEDPPEITQINPALPPALERIVRHCLEKNPEERFQSARDLAFDLESLSGSTESGLRPAVAASGSPRKWTRPAAAAGIAVMLVLAGMLAGRLVGRPPAPEYQTLTFRRGFVYTARFAPDGENILYGAAWEGRPFEIFVTRTGSPESRPLGIANADLLAVSRQGELAVLLNRRIRVGWESSGTLARVSLSGGAPRELAEDVQHADWSPDGESLAVIRYAGRGCRLEYPMGKVLYETTGWTSHVRVSPDGRHLAFLDHPAIGDDRGSVMITDAEGRDRKSLSAVYGSIQGVAWSADGKEVWFSGGHQGPRTMRAVSLSGRERVLDRHPGHTSIQDVFRDGRALATSDYMHRGMAGLFPGSDRERDLSWLDWSFPVDLSIDGRTVLFMEQGVGAGEAFYAMYLRGTDGAPAVSLGEGIPFAISPDGRFVLAATSRPTPHLTLQPTGPGSPVSLPGTGMIDRGNGRFTPDGRRIVFSGREEGKGTRFYLTDAGGGGAPRPVSPEGVDGNFLAVGPEAAAVSGTDGGIVICPLDGGEPRPAPGGEGRRGTEYPIQWSPDGKAIFFLAFEDSALRFNRLDLATGERTAVSEIQPTGREGILDYGPAFITPDGRTYLYSYRRALSTLTLIQGLP